MNKQKSIRVAFAAVFALLLGAVSSFSHPGMHHVMGTVAAITKTSIVVDTAQHNKVTVLLNESTKFTKGDLPAALKDLKVGERVVIHAKENADDKLVAAEVKWGVSSTAMENMKGMDHKE